MQTTWLDKPVPLDLPFVGREKEVVRLKQLHAQRKHVLILGPAGVGKSALIRRVAADLPLWICRESVRLSDIFDALERQLGLNAADLRLVQRKNRLLTGLARTGRTVVFDGLGWTAPRLSSFLECVCQRVPVWLATRSDHPWDVGHFWPLLARFERVELHPFHLRETEALVAAAARGGLIPPETARVVGWLQRRSAGNPRVLRELLRELATGRYELSSPLALRRLELDRRIHKMFPTTQDMKDAEALKG